ncbi:hypothetical protein Tco_0474037 [Tanacetum coccineum]
MTAHHNHWDTSATQDETSGTISSTTTTESPEVVRQLEMMNKNFLDMMIVFGDFCLAKGVPLQSRGPVAYRLDFPKELDGVHDTFHVSNLKKCLADPTLQVPLDEAPGSPVRNEYVKNGQKQSKTDKTEHGNGKSREKSKPKEYTY